MEVVSVVLMDQVQPGLPSKRSWQQDGFPQSLTAHAMGSLTCQVHAGFGSVTGALISGHLAPTSSSDCILHPFLTHPQMRDTTDIKKLLS